MMLHDVSRSIGGHYYIRTKLPREKLNDELGRPDGYVDHDADGQWYEIIGTDAWPVRDIS